MSHSKAAFHGKFDIPRDERSTLAVIPNSIVRVPDNRSDWARKLQKRFDDLCALEKGWDGYDAKPVSFNCAQFTASLLERLWVSGVSAPQIVPGADGTLQLEWHINKFDIEVDILAPYQVFATRFDHISEKDEEIDCHTDFSELRKWIVELGQDRTNKTLEEKVLVSSAL